jgi:hypothetical protein
VLAEVVHVRALLPAVLVLAACTPATDAPSPVVASAEVVESGPVGRTLDVTLERPARCAGIS